MGVICVAGKESLLLNENSIPGVSALGINKYALRLDVQASANLAIHSSIFFIHYLNPLISSTQNQDITSHTVNSVQICLPDISLVCYNKV